MRTASDIRATIRENGMASRAVLREIDAAIANEPNSAHLWILRGDAIQLGEGDPAFPLEEAERSYRQALLINPTSVEAAEELGRFLWAVMDDAESAEPFLLQAQSHGADVPKFLHELRVEKAGA